MLILQINMTKNYLMIQSQSFFFFTILPHIDTDVVHRGEIGNGGLHGTTRGPHVIKEENRHRREAKDA